MRKVVIMRGLPGSGKSTYARRRAGSGGVIHATDDLFCDENGAYRFDPLRLKEYHDLNYLMFCLSLALGAPIVVCDNTNSQLWEFEHYIEAARQFGYKVEIVEMPHPHPEVAAERSIHGVPVHTICRMIERWEKTRKA